MDAGPRIADALSKDRYGIAYSKLRYAISSIKPLALAATNAGPYFPPVKQTVRERTYPLSRVMMVYLNRAPDKPADPKLTGFLRYVLSREGQQAVVCEGGYRLNFPASFNNLHGRNRRCVWSIPTQPFSGAHFAVHPPALIEVPFRGEAPTVDKIVAVRSLREPQNAPIRHRCARRAESKRCK